jgi:hypothetical protein
MDFGVFGLTHWPDWLITLALISTMLLSQRLAYRVAGDIWWERHAIRFVMKKKHREISGFYGEAFTTSLGGAVLLTVGALTPSVSLYEIITGHWAVVTGVLAVCIALYVCYGWWVVEDAKRRETHWKRERFPQLAWTYVVYGPYSVCLYLGVIAIVTLLVMQYIADADAVAGQRASIISQLHAMSGWTHAAAIDPAKTQAAIERIYGDVLVNGSAVAASMNPVFVLIAIATSVMFLLERSPIRDVFLSLPRALAQSTGLLALIFFFLLTTVTYYVSYAHLASESLVGVSSLRPALERTNTDWEIMRRFNEIVIDLARKRSFIGFASTVIDESGAAVVWMALLQWITTRVTTQPVDPADGKAVGNSEPVPQQPAPKPVPATRLVVPLAAAKKAPRKPRRRN